jgi:hypothetical protein
MTTKINVKEFLDRIDTANVDGLFKVSKNGAYVNMTYKQMMEDVFKGRTELTMKDVHDAVNGHTYAPFILFKIKGSMPPQDIDEWREEGKKKIKPLPRWYFENGTPPKQ